MIKYTQKELDEAKQKLKQIALLKEEVAPVIEFMVNHIYSIEECDYDETLYKYQNKYSISCYDFTVEETGAVYSSALDNFYRFGLYDFSEEKIQAEIDSHNKHIIDSTVEDEDLITDEMIQAFLKDKSDEFEKFRENYK